MAQLVKFATEPHKYFAKRKEQFWPLNLIISRESFELKKSFDARSSAFQKTVSQVISEYLDTSAQDLVQANNRGSIIKRQRTVADILTLCAMWHRNVEQEVEAMIKLSSSIAELILNTKIDVKNTEKLQEFLYTNMKNFFHISINLPEQIFSTLPKFKLLECFFASNLDPDQEAQLRIFINKEEHIINLNGLNIQRVFSRAIKNIKAQKD